MTWFCITIKSPSIFYLLIRARNDEECHKIQKNYHGFSQNLIENIVGRKFLSQFDSITVIKSKNVTNYYTWAGNICFNCESHYLYSPICNINFICWKCQL